MMKELGNLNISRVYIKHIDGLRALAVFIVVMLHLDVSFFSGGFIGVDIFFVISGYLITSFILLEINETKTFSFVNFFLRRAKRIIPALVFTLIISFFAGAFIFSPGNFKDLGGSIVSSALSFSNIYFLLQSGYFELAAQYKPLLNTWSLGVEEQFYIFWPLFLFICVSRTSRKFLPVFIGLLFILSLLLSFYVQSFYLKILYYLMPFRVFEFCIGALMVWVVRIDSQKNYILEILCLMGLTLIIYTATTYDSNTVFHSYNAILPCIGSAMVIYAGHAKYLGSVFYNPLSRALGLISYSLYLVHWPIIAFYSYYKSAPLDLETKSIIFACSIVLATIMYFFVEQPFRKISPKLFATKLKHLLLYIVIVLVTALIGSSAYLNRGWLWRLPENTRILTSDVKDPSSYHLSNWGGAGFFWPGFVYQNKRSDIPDIVILGDSHAEMLLTGFYNLIAKPYHLTTYIADGLSCLNLPGLVRISPEQKKFDRSCPFAVNSAIKQLQNNKHAVMIISYSWASQISHTGNMLNHSRLLVNLYSSEFEDYLPLIRAINRLREAIGYRKLVIIGDVPGAGFSDTFSCLTRPDWSKKYCKKHFNSDENTNIKAVNVNKILAQYAKENKNTYFFNPYSVFCSNQVCRDFSDLGKPFYTDSAHLSKAGSAYFISAIKNELLGIIFNAN